MRGGWTGMRCGLGVWVSWRRLDVVDVLAYSNFFDFGIMCMSVSGHRGPLRKYDNRTEVGPWLT